MSNSKRRAILAGFTPILMGLLVGSCGKIGGVAKSTTGTGGSTATAPTALSYKWSALTYTVGTQVATNPATVTGGTPTSYAISPALSAGLTLSSTSGAIGGTPTSASAQTTYTVTASNSAGSVTADIAITVNADESGRAFAAACTMTTSRAYHLSILLNTGNVLLAGGRNNAGTALTTAELYDPATGNCTATGSMNAARGEGGFAALLSSGKVLVGGGLGALASAELYDPGTGLFTATGSLVAGRDVAKSVRLDNGKVLVVGGRDSGGNSLSSAELYDPATETFAATGAMGFTRGIGHSATLLANGSVLVAGSWFGTDPNVADVRSNGEVYDPALGTFTAVSNNMGSARWEHAAALLPNGKVLLAGGRYRVNGASTVTSADLYDPATNAFAVTGTLTGTARRMNNYYGTGAVLLPNGKALIVGSSQDGCTPSYSTTDLYDPTAGTFAASANLGTARQANGTTLLASGKIFISGGLASQCGYGSAVSSTEVFQ